MCVCLCVTLVYCQVVSFLMRELPQRTAFGSGSYRRKGNFPRRWNVGLRTFSPVSYLLPHTVNGVRFCFSAAVCLYYFCMKYLWNRWTDLRQIHREDVFGPSLGRVWMSRSNVKVTRDKKRAVHSYHPRQRRNGTRSLQITSCCSRQDRSAACARFMFGKTTLAPVYIFKFIYLSNY